MKEIQLTAKQQAAAREFDSAIAQLQRQQQTYLKAILDAHDDIAPNSNWRITPDYTKLAIVETPALQPAA